MRYTNFQFQARPSRGFTLIELLISMGLIMILTLGINQVFSMATNTIGMGNRVNEMTRDSRATVAALQQDLSRWATDSPIFYIQTQYVITKSPNGVVINDRRVDSIGFFTRGDYRRVTANSKQIYSPARSTEAWTWIGHCMTQEFTNNVFNLSNVLGKQVILLKDPQLMPGGLPNSEVYIQRSNVSIPQKGSGATLQALPNLSPLNGNSVSTQTGSPIYTSRFDLAGTTIEQFRADLALIDPDYTMTKLPWYDTYKLIYRFQCNPTPRLTRVTDHQIEVNPFFTAENLAMATPTLMNNCSDLIIDFSGDYVTQKEDGTILSMLPDGIVDFIVDRSTGAKTTQWYGLGKRIGNASDSSRGNLDPSVRMLSTPGHLNTPGTPEDPNYFVRGPIDKGGTPLITTEIDNYSRNIYVTTSYNYLWVNGRGLPKQVRISFRQNDPEGRIQVGPWTQFTAGPR